VPAFLVTLERSGPEWDTSKPLEQQTGWPAHAEFMDGLVGAGLIVVGGPLADELRVVHVVEAESEQDVRDTFALDPWAGSHLVVASVEPMTIRLDARQVDPDQ
jgi:uncharacterized protein YciI